MEKRHWKILLIIGILFHIIAAYMMPIGLDAHVHATYVTDQMNDGEGDLEWGELRQDSKFGSTPEQVSSEDKWFAWHMIMQIWFTIFGVSILSMHLLSLAIGLACLAVIYFVTNSLFGKDRALTVTALASIYPPLIRGTGRLYQESAILLLTSLAIYCVVKGLQNPNQKKWWIFPIISIFIICSFKGMPLWMGLVAVVGFYLSQKVQFNLITFTFLAFSTEVFVIYRNGVSLLSVDVIIALISSLIAAVIFLYCAVLLGKKNPNLEDNKAIILQNGTFVSLAVLIGWVAGLWVSEAYFADSGIFEILFTLRNNPRYLTLLFIPLIFIRFLNDESYSLISEENQKLAYSFIAIMVVINLAIFSVTVGERGTQIIGNQLNSEIAEGEDILFISDSDLAMHRMYTMHITLDPDSDKSNLAIWRTTDSGWELELTECEDLKEIAWIVVDYTGIDTIPDGWESVEIKTDDVINLQYRLLKWGESYDRCP
jgi:hypothetical protein